MLKRQQRAQLIIEGGAPAFDPSTVVSGWLRNSSTGTIASVSDVLNPGTPAVASGGTITGNADFSMSSTTGELLWPLTAANNGNAQFGLYMWVKRVGATASMFPWAIDIGTGGASARKIFHQKSGTNGIFRIYSAPSSSTARAGTVTNAFSSTGVWTLYGMELDLASGGAEATRAVYTINGVIQTVNFTDALGTPGAVPVLMPTVTGNMVLFSQGNSNFFDGVFGRNIFTLSAGMPGRTEGLLTQAFRNSLLTFEVPTF
jgi:hypothetical protein